MKVHIKDKGNCSLEHILEIKDNFFVLLYKKKRPFLGNVLKIDKQGEVVSSYKGECESIDTSNEELIVHISGYNITINPDNMEELRTEWVK